MDGDTAHGRLAMRKDAHAGTWGNRNPTTTRPEQFTRVHLFNAFVAGTKAQAFMGHTKGDINQRRRRAFEAWVREMGR